MKENIRRITTEELKKWMLTSGEKSFRARQVMEWIWKKSATSFKQMTNLSTDLRNSLENQFTWDVIQVENIQYSFDQTIKVLFRLHDGLFIEGVIILSEKRVTICISSQVGCKMKCKFCATGAIGFKRNLEIGEIYDQVTLLNDISIKNINKKVSNIVIMGMGEPLHNYENIKRAIYYITSSYGLNISAKRITLSTIGIPEMIKKMADDHFRCNLALSLHSALQEKRQKIIPVARNNSLDSLLESLKYYTKITGNEVTFEYVLLHGINDGKEDAEALLRFTSQVASKVNLIEYNTVEGNNYKKSTPENTAKFMLFLQQKGINVKVRKSRGEDIDAACGQLANKLLKSKG